MFVLYFLVGLIIFCALIDIISKKFRLLPLALSAIITVCCFLIGLEINYLIVIFLLLSCIFYYIKTKSTKK